MKPEILLVNPPVYDFTAYDFWLKPYGMLSIAGFLRGQADFKIFDYLDRLHPFMAEKNLKTDKWHRGKFYSQIVPIPHCLSNIPRRFQRFGLPRKILQQFLSENKPADFVLIQTTMTYWYPAIEEVAEDIRKSWPKAKIILGGNYVTLCPNHAEKLKADLLVKGTYLEPLWQYIRIKPDLSQPGLWEIYHKLNVGVLKLSDGCPFNCTYCTVPEVYKGFRPRKLQRALKELELLCKLGAEEIAFYDDALLYQPEKVLVPFLNEVIKLKIKLNFHTPNALNARFITKELADLMVKSGFKTFYLGFESTSLQWQKQTGNKVSCDELAKAVEYLTTAGTDPANITAYQILGHPKSDIQQLEESMCFVNSLGIRGMLADFSPIPKTPDGELCGKYINLAEPLMHNKSAFPIILLGFEESNRLKDLQQKLNRNLLSS
jgi:radical SAM superfamily enzyme YgiQ (UPF0313 family)